MAMPLSCSYLAIFEDWDPAGWEVLFYAEWTDYEEHGWQAILKHSNQLYAQCGGHNVMTNSEDYWDPKPVTDDQALEIMLDWEEYEQEIQEWG